MNTCCYIGYMYLNDWILSNKKSFHVSETEWNRTRSESRTSSVKIKLLADGEPVTPHEIRLQSINSLRGSHYRWTDIVLELKLLVGF